MLWLIPRLYPDPRLLDVAAHDLRLPGLQRLLARGTSTREAAMGTEAALAQALGVVRQQDWPLAPLTLEADGGTAGDAYWLRADPVHLHLMRDRIVLADTRLTDLTQAEADALTRDLSQHFGEHFSIQARHPQRWYLCPTRPLRLETVPPSLAAGRAIDGVLPHGIDAPAARVWLNEIQMLLHAHPVNQEREARGALPVNSLWLWGGGARPAGVENALPPVYAEDGEARAVARQCGAALPALPAALEPRLLGSPGILLLDALDQPASLGDAFGWREALRLLETNWFSPLAGALRKTGREGVRILDPVSGRGTKLKRFDAGKIWRRPGNLLSGLAG